MFSQENKILPCLGGALFFIMQNIGAYLSSTHKPSFGSMQVVALLHFAGVIGFAAVFPILYRVWSRRAFSSLWACRLTRQRAAEMKFHIQS